MNENNYIPSETADSPAALLALSLGAGMTLDTPVLLRAYVGASGRWRYYYVLESDASYWTGRNSAHNVHVGEIGAAPLPPPSAAQIESADSDIRDQITMALTGQ